MMKVRDLMTANPITCVVLEAQAESGAEHRPTYHQVIDAMQGICAHRHLPAAA